jgi:hypothetical protein
MGPRQHFPQLADLRRLPLTRKSDLRDEYPFRALRRAARGRRAGARIAGTTGKPTVVGYTRAGVDLFAEVNAEPLDRFRRSMAAYAREQAHCLYSPALIDNLERNWTARQRTSDGYHPRRLSGCYRYGCMRASSEVAPFCASLCPFRNMAEEVYINGNRNRQVVQRCEGVWLHHP